MKPSELMDDSNFKFRGYSSSERLLNGYSNNDCVIAYHKNSLGLIFIIKTKKKYMAFSSINKQLSHTYKNSKRLEVNTTLSIMGDDVKIVNEEEFTRMKDKMLINDI